MVSEEDKHSKLIKLPRDLQLDTDIVLAFNRNEKGGQFKHCNLLFRHIEEDVYGKAYPIDPLGAKIINYLYGKRSHKGLSVESFKVLKSNSEPYSKVSILNSIAKINQISEDAINTTIIPHDKLKRLNKDFLCHKITKQKFNS